MVKDQKIVRKPLTPRSYCEEAVSDEWRKRVPWLRDFAIFNPPKDQEIEIRKESK